MAQPDHVDPHPIVAQMQPELRATAGRYCAAAGM